MNESTPESGQATLTSIQGKAEALTGRVTANAVANLVRLFVFGIVAIVLPAYLARHMQRDVFNTWALVIQVGSFVGFLEIGIQIAVSKYVAEYYATENLREASKVLTNASMMLSALGLTGIIAMCVISLCLGKLLPDISPGLLRAAQAGVALYGGSLALSLPASAFSGVFLGLQRNYPVILIQCTGRIAFAILVILSVQLHATFVVTVALASIANLLTATCQIAITMSRVPRIRFAITLIERRVATALLKYCSILGIWSVSQLLISGLDTTLVAHFQFAATAAYAIAATLTSFVVSVQGSMLSPLIPATSALSQRQSSGYLGDVLIRLTRYANVIVVLTCIPCLLFGYPLLTVWVGPSLANQGIHFLWILSVAIAVRQSNLTYSVMVIGLGKQKLATVSPVIEAVVNLTASVLLARRYGAMGIAWGTLIGAFVGFLIHLCISMRLTRPVLTFARRPLVISGILRPALLVLPTLALSPHWLRLQPSGWPLVTIAACGTAALLYFVCLDAQDRHAITEFFQRRTWSRFLSLH